jgi:RNA polymerase sigma factor (sigma-70 family)
MGAPEPPIPGESPIAAMAAPISDLPIAGSVQANHTKARNVIREHGEDAGMDPHDSFADVEQKLRAGDQSAATKVFLRFEGRLIALARAELDTRMRRKEDPEDVVQSVYGSFFRRHHAGQYDLATWDSLWSLLTVITVRKCLNRARHYRAQRRSVAGEVGVAQWDHAADGLSEAIDREPTPLEAVVLAETVEQLVGRLDAGDRAIIELSLQEFTALEISERLGRAERSVRRVRERVRKRLRRMQADEAYVT